MSWYSNTAPWLGSCHFSIEKYWSLHHQWPVIQARIHVFHISPRTPQAWPLISFGWISSQIQVHFGPPQNAGCPKIIPNSSCFVMRMSAIRTVQGTHRTHSGENWPATGDHLPAGNLLLWWMASTALPHHSCQRAANSWRTRQRNTARKHCWQERWTPTTRGWGKGYSRSGIQEPSWKRPEYTSSCHPSMQIS